MRSSLHGSLVLGALLCAAGCRRTSPEPEPHQHRLRVALTLKGQRATCATLSAPPFVLRDARLLVSDLRVVGPDGEVPAAFVPDGHFQTTQVALLDLEDAEGGCEGDTATHAELVFTAPTATIHEVVLTIGVPFALNHANPALAEAPLTAGAMHWGWRAGYKFVRIEAQIAGREARVHLGSTQCEGAINAISSCAHPNRPELRLAIDPATHDAALELSALFGSDPDALDCMGDPEDAACKTAYSALGLGGPATAFSAVAR